MNKQTKILIMATFIAISFQKVSAQNTFPTPSGSVGIGTTSPTRDLEINSTGTGVPLNSMLIHTGQNDANDGLNMESLKIINRMNNSVNYSPSNAASIFSVWREWMQAGSVASTEEYFSIGMWGDSHFGKSLVVDNALIVGGDGTFQSNMNIYNDLTVGNNVDIGNDLTVNHDLFLSNNLRINSLSSGADRMGVVTTSGDVTAWDLPTLDLSGNNLYLKSGSTTLDMVTLPTVSGADNLSITNGVLALRAGSTVLSQVSLPTNNNGDNLGNHVATQFLDMNNHDIADISDLFGSAGGTITFNNGRISTPDVLYVGGNAVTAYQLYVNGSAYCTSGAWSGSDKRFKKDILQITGIKDKLFNIKPYSYKFRTEEFPAKKFNDKISYGFIAQEVKEIFPELVKEDVDGYLAVNYTEFIPMLLQTLKEEDQIIKEQQSQITQLTEQLAALTEKVNAIHQNPTNTPSTSTQNIKSTLEQNVPNPFGSETRIAYNIVEKYTRAFIGVYDLSGKEIKKVALDKAKGEIVFPANNLIPGMYVYSLLVDSQLIDSKKMVIME